MWAYLGFLSSYNCCRFLLVFQFPQPSEWVITNELGAGRPRTAKRAAYVAVGIGGKARSVCLSLHFFFVLLSAAVCIAVFYIVLIQATKNYIGKLFTEDE